MRGAAPPHGDRFVPLGAASEKAVTGSQSAGASDPAAMVRSHKHRPVAPSDRAAPAPPGGLALCAIRGRCCPLLCGPQRSPGDVSERAWPLFHRKISLSRSARRGGKGQHRLSRQGPSPLPSPNDAARTARSPKATGQRLPLPGGWRFAPPRGRHCPLFLRAEAAPGRRIHVSGAALPPEDRLVPLSPASRDLTPPSRSAGASDPAVPRHSRPHRPVAQSDRAAGLRRSRGEVPT